jgi:hypothetical protein
VKQETLTSGGILIALMNRIGFDAPYDYSHKRKHRIITNLLFVSINKFLYYHMPLFENGQDLFDTTLWTGQMIHIISLPNEYL